MRHETTGDPLSDGLMERVRIRQSFPDPLSERTASRPVIPSAAQQITAAAEKARSAPAADESWPERRARLIREGTNKQFESLPADRKATADAIVKAGQKRRGEI